MQCDFSFGGYKLEGSRIVPRKICFLSFLLPLLFVRGQDLGFYQAPRDTIGILTYRYAIKIKIS